MAESDYQSNGEYSRIEHEKEHHSLYSLTEYTNRQLLRLGVITSSLNLTTPTESDSAEIARAILVLVQQRETDFARFNETDNRLRRQLSDYQTLEYSIQAEKRKTEQLERENREILAKLRRCEVQIKEFSDKIKNSQEEIKMLRSTTQQTKALLVHEKRKWEREQNSLKQKLLKLSADKLKEGGVLFKVLNPSASTGRRASDKDEFYQQILSAAEERQQMQIHENQRLKQSLYNVMVEMQHMHASVTESDEFREMPFELVQESIESSVRESLQKLRDAWNNEQNAKQLENELDEKNKIIDEQVQMLWQQHARLDELAEHIEEISGHIGQDEAMGRKM